MPETYLTQSRLRDITDKFPHTPIAVIGDFFLDEYLILDKNLAETSIETGLEAHQIIATRKSPGAAGTVTNILRSLGVPVTAVGFSGDDGHGFELRRCLENIKVNLNHFATFPDRFTPTYTKPMLLENGCETELSRLDTKNRQPLNSTYEAQINRSLGRVIPEVNAVLAIDQVQESNCGVITEAVRSELAALALQYPEKIIMADSREHMHLFKNTVVKFNLQEASKMFNLETAHPSTEYVDRLTLRLFEHYQQPIILTLGADGMQVRDLLGTARIPAIPVRGPIDIVGAGDSVMASIGASLSAGASLVEAAMIGTLTASIIVQQIGTTGTATRSQIEERFSEVEGWLNDQVRVVSNL